MRERLDQTIESNYDAKKWLLGQLKFFYLRFDVCNLHDRYKLNNIYKKCNARLTVFIVQLKITDDI